jgi:hypothetical protein
MPVINGTLGNSLNFQVCDWNVTGSSIVQVQSAGGVEEGKEEEGTKAGCWKKKEGACGVLPKEVFNQNWTHEDGKTGGIGVLHVLLLLNFISLLL